MSGEEKLIVIWAGEDIYRIERCADIECYLKHLLPVVREEFGTEAEIAQVNDIKFEIRVEKVRVA